MDSAILTSISNGISFSALAVAIAFCGFKLYRNREIYTPPARNTLLSLVETLVGLAVIRTFWLYSATYGRGETWDEGARWILVVGALITAHGITRFIYVFLDRKPFARTLAFLAVVLAGTLIGMAYHVL